MAKACDRLLSLQANDPQKPFQRGLQRYYMLSKHSLMRETAGLALQRFCVTGSTLHWNTPIQTLIPDAI